HSLRFWGFRRIYHIKARLGMTDYDLVDQKGENKAEPADRENDPQNLAKQQDDSPDYSRSLLYRSMAFGHQGIHKMLQKKGQPAT
ncbi:MAG: hypothetical protein ACOX6Y_02450, partial [Christensenellales bacterium]